VDPRLILVIVVAVGLWVPLARFEWFGAHEGYNYVLRTVEWAAELRAGALYPRWSPDLYGGHGSPFFVFTAPVVYAIAGLLTATYFSAFAALKAVILLGSILSGVATYALVERETRDRSAALLSALAYLAAPYRIGNVYDRGDLAEFLSIALLPLVVLLYRACAREPLPLRACWLAAAASVVHGIFVMTHPVLGMWGSALVGLVVLQSAIRLALARAWRRAALLALALGCAPGVAGLYVVPAMAYRTSTQTARMVQGFYRAEDHWLWMRELFMDKTPLFARNFLMIGHLVALAAFVVAIALVVNPRKALGACGWLGLSLLLIFLNSKEASWFWAPGRVPLTEFTQFPWRLIGPAALFSAIALGVGMAAVSRRISQPARTSLAILGSAALFFFVSWPYASVAGIPYSGSPADPEGIRQGMYSVTDANEFLPLRVDAPAAPRPKVVASAERATVALEHSDGSRHTIVARASERGAQVRLALLAFPGWTIETVTGPARAKLDTDKRGFLLVRLAKPGEYRLRVVFGSTTASQVGLLLTAVSLALLGAVVAYGAGVRPLALLPRRRERTV
jgi:hypothetical protein